MTPPEQEERTFLITRVLPGLFPLAILSKNSSQSFVLFQFSFFSTLKNTRLVSCYSCNKLLQTQWLETMYISQFWRSEVWMGLTGLRSRCQQGRVFSGVSWGQSVSCLSHLLEAARIPWLLVPFHLQSQQSNTAEKSISLSLPLCVPFSCHFLSLLMTLVITFGPTSIMLDYLPPPVPCQDSSSPLQNLFFM